MQLPPSPAVVGVKTGPKQQPHKYNGSINTILVQVLSSALGNGWIGEVLRIMESYMNEWREEQQNEGEFKFDDGPFTPEHGSWLLGSLPQCRAVEREDVERLVDCLWTCIRWSNESVGWWWRKRARWAVLEFHQEGVECRRKVREVDRAVLCRR